MNLKNVIFVLKVIDQLLMVIVVYQELKIVKNMGLQIQIVIHILVNNVCKGIFTINKTECVLKAKYHFAKNMNMMNINVHNVNKTFI